MTGQQAEDFGVDPVLRAVPLESLKLELNRRDQELLRLQIEANDRWIAFMSATWPHRTMHTFLPIVCFVIFLFFIRHHLPFNGKMPIEILPTLSLFGMFVPVSFVLYKDNKIWKKFRDLHPENATLIDSYRDEENRE